MTSREIWPSSLLPLSFFIVTQSSALVLQPDDVDRGDFNHMEHNNTDLCTRTCKEGETRTCYYKFYLEFYTTLGGACGKCPTEPEDCFRPQCVSADGFERSILTVNRRLPAPSIQVCKGDTIIADVKNQMPGSETSIHWHGIRQKDTPWMDGVPMVTQCPIMEGQTFRYRFLVDKAGSFFWHSHDGLQKVDGIVGSLIVRQPDSENPVRDQYDFDLPSHVMVVEDWMHPPSNEGLPGLYRRILGQGPDAYLINGRGVHVRSLYDLYGSSKTPMAEFRVTAGKRYRFRIVSGTCLACPFRITFQDHRPLVISVDDNPIEPVQVDSVVLSAGERYDVVIEASQPIASYWIQVRGLGTCAIASQAAILQYEGSPTSKPTLPHWTALLGYNVGITMNPRNSACNEGSLARGICVSQLRSKKPSPPQVLKSTPDRRLTMAFGFHEFSKRELYETNMYKKFFVPLAGLQLVSLINNISNIVPPAPLLTQLYDIPPSLLCDQCAQEYCECLHLIKIPLNSVVEIIIADTSEPTIAAVTHPFHIHGYNFHILEQGIFKKPMARSLENLQSRLMLPRNITDFLPAKDTVTIPANGYAVVRVLADNPGYWLYHCHFSFHLAVGMSAVIQVGETSDMKTPPTNFPRCNEYLPPIEGLNESQQISEGVNVNKTIKHRKSDNKVSKVNSSLVN